MSNMRVINLTSEEYIELKSSDLQEHLFKVVEILKGERQERMNYAQSLARNVEEAMTLFAGYVAEIPAKGEGMLFQDAMRQVASISKRISRLQMHANSMALTSIPALVRLSLEQAKEFSL